MKVLLIRFPTPNKEHIDDAYKYLLSIRNYLDDVCKVIWIFEERGMMSIETIEL